MLQFFSYRFPFHKPFKIAGRSFSHREGIVLKYSEKELEAFGEIAPLPGFSEETLEDIKEVLLMNREHIQQALSANEATEVIQILDRIHQFPALSFGLDTLLHDAEAKRKDQPLWQLLFEEAPSVIPANAVLPFQPKNEALLEAQNFIKKGFTTLKIKMGQDFDSEKELLTALRDRFPDIQLRIDANQAWSEQEAIQNLNSLEELSIEYCEQPVSASDITSLKNVRKAVNIPIAADESARNKKAVAQLIEEQAADLIIIKPMLMGTFQNISVTKQLADTHNIEMVFTTSLEAAIGRAATVTLASGMSARGRAQGLATGSLLSKDLTMEEELNDSEINLTNKPGLGISVHSEGLKEIV